MDTDCTTFLEWALPQLELRWPGFRKVRRQVCKRLARRMRDLGLANFAAYRARLESDPMEWRILDECCHITISRFFRDKAIFEALRTRVLPDIAARAEREARNVQVWSAGCASGEEPYTIKILWDIEVARAHSTVSIAFAATDIDDAMLARARNGCFKLTSLHELPRLLVEQAFEQVDQLYCLKSKHRQGVEFINQDLRSEMPARLFDLILCRYVAFTYFAPAPQCKALARMLERLRPNGYLVIGADEKLPDIVPGIVSLDGERHIFQKIAGP
jgi:chemotaxis protein methyltransferase CheR